LTLWLFASAFANCVSRLRLMQTEKSFTIFFCLFNLHDIHRCSMLRYSRYSTRKKKKRIHIATKRATRVDKVSIFSRSFRARSITPSWKRETCVQDIETLDLPHSLTPRRAQYPNITDVLICLRQFLRFDVSRVITNILSVLSEKFYNACGNRGSSNEGTQTYIQFLRVFQTLSTSFYISCFSTILLSCFSTILLSHRSYVTIFCIYLLAIKLL